MIGEAALHGYDIQKRVTAFYFSGAIFFVFFILFLVIAWLLQLFSENIWKNPETKIINYTSLAGIVFCFFNVWQNNLFASFELLFCIQKTVIGVFILKFFVEKDNEKKELINCSFYSIAFVLAFALFCLLLELLSLAGIPLKIDLFISIFVIVIIFAIGKIIYGKYHSTDETKITLNILANVFVPLAFIPFVSFLKDEIFLILIRHQQYFFSERILYSLFIFILLFCCYWRYKKIKKKNITPLKSNEQLISKRYFPIFIVSVFTFALYNPFINISTEMFEAGNRYLPIMEFQKFGVVPIFEKFNSHALSELFYSSIYVFFNGLHGREMFIYDFLNTVLWSFVVYTFLNSFFRNPYIAFFLVCFFPLTEILLSDYSCISLLTIFIIAKIINEKPSLKSYLLLLFFLVFLLLWRIDIGYPAIVASVIIVLIYLFSRKQFSINKKYLFQALSLTSVFIIGALLLIGWCRQINVFDKLLSALNYLASAQTYGIVSLGDFSMNSFKIQYFIFPIIIILILLFILVHFKKLTISKSQRFVIISFLFLIVYYLVNFQRGVVRHSFFEGHDNSLSSFSFFIIPAAIVFLFINKSKIHSFCLFVLITAFLIMSYKYPSPAFFQNVFTRVYDKTTKGSRLEFQKGGSRLIDTSNYEETNYGEFKNFVSNKLNSDETFIDFSNSPMLYFFTEKITPSYFYQNPLTIHNDYLQNKFIDEVKKYNAPYLVFSHMPKGYWDNVDGVPNTLRHYRMAEYFYSEYSPFIIINDFCIWKKNLVVCENNQIVIFESNSMALDTIKTIKKNVFVKGKNILFKIKTKKPLSTTPLSVSLISNKNTKSLDKIYYDEITQTAYFCETEEFSVTSFSIDNELKNIENITVISCDYVPDFYSSVPEHFNLKMLPYIWGAHDTNLNKSSKITIELKSKTEITSGISYFDLPEIDKKNGNTLLLKMLNNSINDINFVVFYGSKKGGYKGSFDFILPKEKGLINYAVRISSQFNWHNNDIDYIGLQSKNGTVKINEISLMGGD